MPLEDQEKLVKECLKGKPGAQKRLYDQFASSMLGVCYRYTKNLQDAENVLQEGFVKVFLNLHKFRNEGELGGWIRKIMVNSCITYLKANRRYSYEMPSPEYASHPVIQDDLDLKMDVKQLAGLIRELPSGYQTIFNLHAIEGFSHVEIGGMLGISDGTSRSQYARARSMLMKWIRFYSSQAKGSSYG